MDVVSKLKELAVNPSNLVSSYDSFFQLCDQILKFRTAFFLSDTGTPLRKRKYEMIMRGQLHSSPGFSTDMFSPKHVGKTSVGELSELCLLNSEDAINDLYHQLPTISQNSGSLLTHEDHQWDTQMPVKFSPMDSDESVTGPDILNSCIEKPKKKKKKKKKKKSSKTGGLKSVRSSTTCLESNGHWNLRELTTISGSVPLKVVPIGPLFQVGIPPWNGPGGNQYQCDTRWLGTRVWPVSGVVAETGEKKSIGQGMQDSICCCSSPGSMDCVAIHTREETRTLECELGDAFLSWRFQEMGYSVLKCWTPKEEKRFVWFLRNNEGSNEEGGFSKRVLRALPSKSREDIMRYYLGVFIPRLNRMAQSSGKHVDSDGDEVDAMGVSRGKGRVQCSKYLADHHLRLPR